MLFSARVFIVYCDKRKIRTENRPDLTANKNPPFGGFSQYIELFAFSCRVRAQARARTRIGDCLTLHRCVRKSTEPFQIQAFLPLHFPDKLFSYKHILRACFCIFDCVFIICESNVSSVKCQCIILFVADC